MGLFSRISKGLSGMVGGIDAETAQIGLPAQAELLQVIPQGTTVQMGGAMVERVCEFTVRITMDDVPPYQAQVRQRIPEPYLGRLRPGAMAVVAARVHPQDPHRIALDFNAPPPQVRAARGGDPRQSAAYLLANGEPAQAVIVSAQSLSMTNPEGVPLYGFVLTVIPQDGRQPYQVQVGNPAPATALPYIFPGSRVPVRLLPDTPQAVVIDWSAAGASAA